MYKGIYLGIFKVVYFYIKGKILSIYWLMERYFLNFNNSLRGYFLKDLDR